MPQKVLKNRIENLEIACKKLEKRISRLERDFLIVLIALAIFVLSELIAKIMI